jgi:hypothetical protein
MLVVINRNSLKRERENMYGQLTFILHISCTKRLNYKTNEKIHPKKYTKSASKRRSTKPGYWNKLYMFQNLEPQIETKLDYMQKRKRN